MWWLCFQCGVVGEVCLSQAMLLLWKLIKKYKSLVILRHYHDPKHEISSLKLMACKRWESVAVNGNVRDTSMGNVGIDR